MSDPKRYTFEAREVLDANGMVCFVGVSTLTHPMGKYVSYEDYARLKAEVERLTQVSEWQPIQTAPKNYTKILCLWPIKTAYRDSKGYWSRDEMDYWEKHEGELPEPIFWKPIQNELPNAANEGNPNE